MGGDISEARSPQAKKLLVDSMKRIFYPAEIAQGVREMMKVGDTNSDNKLSAAELAAIDLSQLSPLLQELLANAGSGLRGNAE